MAINKLFGVLTFVQLDSPKACFEASKGKEFKSSIVISEDDADAWDEEYPKQSAKTVKTSDFEGIYKIPAPFPEQRKQHIVTLRRNTHLANGEELPAKYQPKVLHKQGNTLVDVTTSVLPANGSVGAMSVDVWESPKYGNLARLKNVLVTEMIEYTRTDSGEPGSEFEDELSDASEAPTKPSKAETKATPKTASKTKPKAQEEPDDSPF